MLGHMAVRSVAGKIVYAACFVVGLHCCALGQSANLTYQKRGGYSEGTRTAPSTGSASLDLIALLIDYREPARDLPSKFRAMFYLPKQDSVYLTIRELDPEYYYWLSDVDASGWKAGGPIQFEWATGSVIRSLNWRGHPLSLDQLGATARLGNAAPGQLEVVAPVALYHSEPPKLASSYRFIFWPGERMDLTFEVFAEGTSAGFGKERFSSVLARQSHLFVWKAGDRPDGWYELVVSGYALRNSARVDRIVRFYHRRRLGD